ncbi:MAG: class D sortase, partial [Bryobacteraceae bacterium]
MKRRPAVVEYRDYRTPLFLSAYSLEIRQRVRKHLEAPPARSRTDWEREWEHPFEFQRSAAQQADTQQKVRIHALLNSPASVADNAAGRAIAGLAAAPRPGVRRWAERTFLAFAVIGFSIWLGSIAVTRLYQSWDAHVFDRELHDKLAAGRPTVPPAQPPEIPENGLIGRLSIPRLHLSEIVRQGDSDGTLRLSLGHVPGTAIPGQHGNVSVAGHRDTLFRGLRNVRRNDTIVFETSSGRYEYRVESTRIVTPQDVSVLDASGYPELTLVTC